MTVLSQPVRVHNLPAWFICVPPTAIQPGCGCATFAARRSTASRRSILPSTRRRRSMWPCWPNDRKEHTP